MTEMMLTRRQLAVLLAMIAGGTSTDWFWNAAAAGTADVPLKIGLPKPNDPGTEPPFDVFLALSNLVTCRTALDQEMARRMYPLFLDEPWGPEHITKSYRAISALVPEMPEPVGVAACFKGARLGKGEAWFVSHLLTTWYLGIYYHEERPTRRVGYETALMFDPIREDIPVWFTGSREINYWAVDR